MQSQTQHSESFIKDNACIQISNPVEFFQKDYSVTEIIQILLPPKQPYKIPFSRCSNW